MKKKLFVFSMMLVVAASGVIACSSDNDNNTPSGGTEEVVPGNNHKVLVPYFSEPLPDGVDANTSLQVLPRVYALGWRASIKNRQSKIPQCDRYEKREVSNLPYNLFQPNI